MYRLLRVSCGTLLVSATLSFAAAYPYQTKMTAEVCARLLKKEETYTCLPKPLKEESLEALFAEQGVLSLEALKITEKLPDLRKEISTIFYNGRPDAQGGRYRMQLSSGEERVVSSGEKVFLRAQRKGKTFSYHFSDTPGNLWVTCNTPKQGSVVDVQVFFLDSEGKRVMAPSERGRFSLALSHEMVGGAWEINGDRVDASFGVKQQMRRLGKDVFLVVHGGPEYAVAASKERFDFRSSQGKRYSQYLSLGDWLFWTGDRWVPRGQFMGDPATAPLLEVKRLEDKTAVFDIWNVEGNVKQSVTLMRYQTSPMEVTEASREISFVGMKSWSSAVVVFQENALTRTVVRPDDWLIRKEAGWEKLTSSEDIEDYVSGRLEGPLFVVEGVVKEEGEFILKGHVFNSNRTVLESVAIPMKGEQYPIMDGCTKTATLQTKESPVVVEKAGESER